MRRVGLAFTATAILLLLPATGAYADPSPSSTDAGAVVQSADLDVSKSVDNTTPLTGQQVNVTNHGPSDASR